ncbi:MAG: glycerol-3-phosphate dehydrogenase/oxidase, partial [Proteobacteria bacterium]|nr:glycerol-3-phosphate dehydrogenase/oxidase [Pseudomonadota bacterium]
YYDGQFDDSRLAINLAQTAVENEAIVLNYMPVTKLLKDRHNLVCGVEVTDMESGENHRVRSRVVINATGVFVDTILSMDDAGAAPLVRPSQGIHFVLDKSFLQGDSAIMIPKTSDGRVLFAVPWHGKVVVGTTDTPLATTDIHLEPRALEEEIDFILTTAAQYLKKDPKKEDVLSVFAGLRPLAAQQDSSSQSTKEISRSHRLMVSLSGLITITGGKWTTYRKMAEDTVNKAWMVGGLPEQKCVTETMPIHGYVKNTRFDSPGYYYGSDRTSINAMIQAEPDLGRLLHPDYEYTRAQVVWAVRNEMARTVEDFLSRRIRMLLLDARVSMAMAPEVAQIMARELNRGPEWIQAQVTDYQALAKGYILS